MKTLTVRIPEDLDLKLAAVAAKRRESKSNLIRAAIESIVDTNEAIARNSCLDLAKDLSGVLDGPSDLSCNKAYLKGYGQ